MATEYKTIEADGFPSAEQFDELNQLGEEGWKLDNLSLLGTRVYIHISRDTIEQAQPSYLG